MLSPPPPSPPPSFPFIFWPTGCWWQLACLPPPKVKMSDFQLLDPEVEPSWNSVRQVGVGMKGYRCWQMTLLDARSGKQLCIRAAALYVRMGEWAWLCAYGWMCVCVHAGVSTCKHALTCCFRSSGLFSALSKWACHSPRVRALEQSEIATPRLAWSRLMACLLGWFDVFFFSLLSPQHPPWLVNIAPKLCSLRIQLDAPAHQSRCRLKLEMLIK